MVETVENIWCLNCGMNSFTKAGISKEGKQRIQCKYCKVKTSIDGLLPGKPIKPLLSILQKEYKDLTREELYILGFLIADASLTDTGVLNIQISAKDVELLYLCEKILGLNKEVSFISRKDGRKHCQIGWSNKQSVLAWERLGIVPRKTGKKYWLKFMNSVDFVRGFLDGDGCIYYLKKDTTKSGKLSFSSANPEFLTGLVNYLSDNFKVKLATIYNQKNIYIIRYYHEETLLIAEGLYQNSEGLRLERKYNKYLEIKNRHMINESQSSLSN